MRPPRIVIYPFLAAEYSVLALAAQNVHEAIWLRDLIWPLLISLAVASGAWIVSRLVTRDVHVRAVAAFVGVLWFSAYGYFDQFLARQPWLYLANPHRYAVPLFLLLLSAVAYLLVRRWPGQLSKLSRYLNVTSAILLAFSIPGLLHMTNIRGRRAAVRTMADSVPVPSASMGSARASGRVRPDIYLIILDEYTGAQSLARNYGFDNRPFLDRLRRLGFTVPVAPHSNYVHTHLALAAMLNWHLLDDRPAQLGISGNALAIDYAAIEDNRTWQFLHDQGYRFVFFPSASQVTPRNRHADLQLPDPAQMTSEFEVTWRRTTLASPVLYWWCRAVGCHSGMPYKPPPAELIDWRFRQLGQMPDSASPQVVFAHFILPHRPYIFNADCSQRAPYWPNDREALEPQTKDAYVQQVTCVNRKVSALVAKLLAKSKSPPIIILQADHGYGRIGRTLPELHDAAPDRVAERIDPFAAYYLPGHPEGVVYDSITPVNVLPRIFNYYFDAKIPLQPDATYWSTWDHPFQFTRIR